MNTELKVPAAVLDTPRASAATVLRLGTFKWGLIALVVLIIGFFALTQPSFMTVTNWLIILQSATVVVIVSLGQTVVMATGGFDLSLGANLGLVVMVTALVMVRFAYTGVTAIFLGLLAGALVGGLNALLIVVFRIPDLVATLATMFVVNGATLIATTGQTVNQGQILNGVTAPGKFTADYRWIGTGDIFGIPVSIVLTIVVVAIVYVLMNKTKWGRALYAVGGNPVAAGLVGISVARYRMYAYVVAGLLAAVAGIVLSSRLGMGTIGVGDGYLLQSVAAALIGFAVLGANKPNVLGTVVGAVFVAILLNGLTMFNFPYYTQDFTQGALLILALLMSYTLSPRRRR